MAAPSPRASLGRRTVCGRTEQRRPPVSSVTKLRLEWYWGVFLLLQQRSKHPREVVITPKASTTHLSAASRGSGHWVENRGRGAACGLTLNRIFVLSRGGCAQINYPCSPPRPSALATLVQYYCMIIGQYRTPLPTFLVYAIYHAMFVYRPRCGLAQAGTWLGLYSILPLPILYEQALVCLSNRETVDASRGRTFHCKMANKRLITVFFSNSFGLIHLAI